MIPARCIDVPVYERLCEQARLLCLLKRTGEAKRLYIQALRAAGDSHGEESLPVAKVLSEIGFYYLRLGRIEQAKRFLHKSLEVCRCPGFVAGEHEDSRLLEFRQQLFKSLDRALQPVITIMGGP